MNKITLTLISLFFLIFNSCKKDEGEGGKATIKGKIITKEYEYVGGTNPWKLVDEYNATDERVYIIYGDNTIFDDDTRTHYDGNYQFKWLRKGSYRIFSYSEDTSDTYRPPNLEPVEVEIAISTNKEEVTAADIVIVKVVR